MKEPWNYPLFELMSIEYGVDLLDTELEEIIAVALKCEQRRQESLEKLKEQSK